MKMKKQIAMMMLLAFGSVAMLTGCGSDKAEDKTAEDNQAQTTGDGSWDRVLKAGKITAGLDDAYPPMGFHDPETDELTGFDIEMAALISEKIGVDIEFVPADWNTIVPSLNSGKFDVIISGMNMMDERKAAADFVPYGVAGQALIVKKDRADVKEIEEQGIEYFKDKVIGTQLGSTGASVANNQGFEEGKNLTLYKAYPDATLDLNNGRIDALVIDNFNAIELLSKGDYMQVGDLIVDLTDGEDSAKIGIAMNKEDDELQEKLQGAVNELIADGTLGELAEKWTGVDFTKDLVEDAKAAVGK